MHNRQYRPGRSLTDRQDQAIGRVLRLLPLLPVKELDALADRLGQRVRESSNGDSLWAHRDPAAERDSSLANEPAMTEAELAIDMVGT